jgi:hypothetical protein
MTLPIATADTTPKQTAAANRTMRSIASPQRNEVGEKDKASNSGRRLHPQDIHKLFLRYPDIRPNDLGRRTGHGTRCCGFFIGRLDWRPLIDQFISQVRPLTLDSPAIAAHA